MAKTQSHIAPTDSEKSDKMYADVSLTEEKVGNATGKDHYNDWPNDHGVMQRDHPSLGFH